MSTAPPRPIGMVGATAARLTPRIRRTSSVAPLSRAPVLPAERKAWPRLARSSFRPTVIEESGFLRQTVEGLSQLSTVWVQWTISMPWGRS